MTAGDLRTRGGDCEIVESNRFPGIWHSPDARAAGWRLLLLFEHNHPFRRLIAGCGPRLAFDLPFPRDVPHLNPQAGPLIRFPRVINLRPGLVALEQLQRFLRRIDLQSITRNAVQTDAERRKFATLLSTLKSSGRSDVALLCRPEKNAEGVERCAGQ